MDGSGLDCKPGKVLWIDYENEAGTTARRMRAGGFDPDSGFVSLNLEDEKQSVPMLTAKLKDGTREICTYIEAAVDLHSDIRLVVIDSLFAGTSGVGEKDSEFASPLVDLSAIATRLNIAILILHHPRKTMAKSTQDDTEVEVHVLSDGDLRGTTAILGVIRSLIAIDRPVDSPVRRIYLKKTSYTDDVPRRLGFTLEDARIVPCEAPTVTSDRPRRDTKSNEIKRWLEYLLAAEPRLADDVETAAEGEGFSFRTVGEVSRKMHVVKGRVNPDDNHSPWQWSLAAEPETQSEVDAREQHDCQVGQIDGKFGSGWE